jgi:phosphate transport system permease protein
MIDKIKNKSANSANPFVKTSSGLGEFAIMAGLIACSVVAIFVTIGIVFSLIFETLRFFKEVPITDFLFGLHWSPQTAVTAEVIGSSGAFGAVPLITGTLLISFIAMTIATPLGLASAIYLAEFASKRTRSIAKPLLEMLAGIPSVVYGFFAALTIAPFIRDSGAAAGFQISSESALAAGIAMGIMVVPLVSSLSDDVINSVPQSLRDASLGLGATHAETVRKVVLPAAIPGISGSLLLATSSAIGETMIVVMAAGLAANLTLNPFEAVTTVTVQIVTLLTGDQEFDSAKTLSAFALGLFLFVVTLILNVIALKIVNRFREQYD